MPSELMKAPAAQFPGKGLQNVPDELVDHFIKGPMMGKAVQVASRAFKKAWIDRALGCSIHQPPRAPVLYMFFLSIYRATVLHDHEPEPPALPFVTGSERSLRLACHSSMRRRVMASRRSGAFIK